MTTAALGLLLACAMIFIDLWLGSGAYGVFALIPAVIFNAGQTIALLRSTHIDGVSPVFLLLAVANQVIWLTCAILVADLGTTVGATTGAILTTFNLVWYSLRRIGLRALRPPLSPPDHDVDDGTKSSARDQSHR